MMLGVLKEIALDVFSQNTRITLELDGGDLDILQRLMGKLLSIRLKPYKERRSLKANGYYWTLVNQIAATQKLSSARVHNIYLGNCNYKQYIGGEIVGVYITDTESAYNEAMEKREYHIAPTSKVRDGRRWWVLLKGSSDMNSAEMARLIDFAVQDAEQLGIETIPREEIDRLIEQYGKEHDKK